MLPAYAGRSRVRQVIISPLTPREVYAVVGNSADLMRAMVRAEKYGHAIAHGAHITHAGYSPNVSEFNASTSLYRVTY